MSRSDTSEIPISSGRSGAHSTPEDGNLPPSAPLDSMKPPNNDMSNPHRKHRRTWADIDDKILEYNYRSTEQHSAPKVPRFALELNLAAGKLRQEFVKIRKRIRDRENLLFSPVDELALSVEEAVHGLNELFHNCHDIDFSDEETKNAIEDIIPKLLKHAKMVARHIPEPKPLIGPEDRRHLNALPHLYEKVGEAERDPAKWEDVKKMLLEAKTPNAYYIASSFYFPYDKLELINRRIQLEAQRIELVETEAELVSDEKRVEDFWGDKVEEDKKEWLTWVLKNHPEMSVPMTEGRDFYQKHLQGAASEEEVEEYYDDHPFDAMDRESMETWVRALSHALSEHSTLAVEKAK